MTFYNHSTIIRFYPPTSFQFHNQCSLAPWPPIRWPFSDFSSLELACGIYRLFLLWFPTITGRNMHRTCQRMSEAKWDEWWWMFFSPHFSWWKDSISHEKVFQIPCRWLCPGECSSFRAVARAPARGKKGCGCHPFYGSQLPSFQAKKIKVLEDSWVLQVLGSFGWKWQISRPTFGSCLVGIGMGVSQGDCGQPV